MIGFSLFEGSCGSATLACATVSVVDRSIVQTFLTDYAEYRGNYDAIVDEIYSKIVNYCTAPFIQGEKYLSAVELEKVFQHTYDFFFAMRDEVFTTNYDPSIEIWCQKRNIELLDNTVPTKNPEIRQVNDVSDVSLESAKTNLSIPPSTPVFPQPQVRASLKLVRLHGSVWVYETRTKRRVKINRPKDRLLFDDWYADFGKKPLMIFPGQESVLATGEWDVLYQHFKKKLRGSCLVIGYSFQDDLINQAFIDSLKQKSLTHLGILDPEPRRAVENLYWDTENIPREKIIEISGKFGQPQIFEQICAEWMRQRMHIEFPNGIGAYVSQSRNQMRKYLE